MGWVGQQGDADLDDGGAASWDSWHLLHLHPPVCHVPLVGVQRGLGPRLLPAPTAPTNTGCKASSSLVETGKRRAVEAAKDWQRMYGATTAPHYSTALVHETQ
jgi:hypothetical protein